MVLKSYCTAILKNKLPKEKRLIYEMSWEKCFMCNKINISASIHYESIDKCIVPASNKPISVVLQHLANLVQTKLVFQPGACICRDCLQELTDYDALMLNLLATQKKLTQQLQESLRSSAEHLVESNAEVHIEVVEIADDELKNDEPQKRKMEIDVISSDKEDVEECAVDVSERKRKRQECVMCGEEFRSKYQLQNHVAETHNSQVVHTCNICGVVRRDEEYLELHMNIHEGKTENECRYCPKKFSRPVNTLRHMRMHWDKKKYQCEKCGERFSLDNMLYNHRLRHEAEENPLICNICNQSFKSRKTFNHHILIHQDNRPRHYCNKCPKSFTERYTLKMHMKSHENSVSSQLEPIAHLEEVVSQLKSEPQLNEDDDDDDADLTVIVEEVQSTDLFVSCVICSLNFESKELLEQHLQSEHDVILES